MDPALWEMLEGHQNDIVEAIIRLKHPQMVPQGVRLISRFDKGRINTCRMRRGDIIRIRKDPATLSLKAPDLLKHEDPFLLRGPLNTTDTTVYPSDIRRPPGLRVTGKGVVVGFIDNGFDFLRQIFRKPDGSTRLLALWDQSSSSRALTPAPYGYGTLHLPNRINRALRSSNPYKMLGYNPWHSEHGTHVAHIAVGNGREAGLPEGVAPEAHIVFVDIASRDTWGLANQGDSVSLLEAFHFISRVAGNLPLVVNISLGQTGGPHIQGCTPFDIALDAFLNERPDKVCCQSSGNYYQSQIHASGWLRNGKSRTLTWWVEPGDRTPNEMEIWYPDSDAFSVEIESPDGSFALRVPPGKRSSIVMDGQVVGQVYHRLFDPNCKYHNIEIFLYTNALAGPWHVTIIGEEVINGRYNVWVERDPKGQSYLDARDANPFTTTNTICNGRYTIAVGAYDSHSPHKRITSFSSSGPTADGSPVPHILGPGKDVLSACPTPIGYHLHEPFINTQRMSGTSMAAPHVSGCAALILEAVGRPLRIQEIRKILLDTAEPANVSGADVLRAGWGYLDIEKAVAAADKFNQNKKFQSQRMRAI